MTAVAKSVIHARLLEALGPEVVTASSADEVPFLVELTSVGALAVYAFTLTDPSGGRPTGEFKIQVIAPGQARHTHSALRIPTGAFGVLLGWSPSLDVFAFWDLYAHDSFAYSQNMQVKGAVLWQAHISGISTTSRHLRGRPEESVIVCQAGRVLAAIHERIYTTVGRLSRGAYS